MNQNPPDKDPARGWDIRLQCTVCGTRVRRHRNDYNGAIGDKPKPTVTTTCSNCTCNAGYPPGDVKTVHFIDYATPAELATI
jgi:alkaline phosphatase